MRKSIYTLTISLILFSFEQKSVQAQCNAAFNVTTNQSLASFTSAVSGPGINHSWRFGDGAYGYGASTYHSYANPGTYQVVHILYDSLQSCLDSVMQAVTVSFTPTCHASFYTWIDSVYNYQHIFYSNSTATGTTIQNYIWSVDGVTTLSGPYAAGFFPNLSSGSHTICLTIHTASGCVSTTCDTVAVPNYCNGTASFTYTASPSNSKLISFTPSPNQANRHYTWWFGDGHLSMQRMPVHQYATGGNYSVKLSIYDSALACIDTVRQNIFVSGASDSCTAFFTDTLTNGGLAHFTAVSNQTITSQIWTIFSIPDSSLTNVTLTTNNPSYQFTDTGSYVVCLTLTTNTGCVRNYCEVIYVGSVGTGRPANTVPAYPNPVTGSEVKFNITLDAATRIQYKIIDQSGNVRFQSEKPGAAGLNTIVIPVERLNRGQYFIDIMYGEQRKRSIFQKL